MTPLAARSPVDTAVRLLSFRLSTDEMAALNGRDLALGLALTWIVGVGRTWDDATVGPLRRSGLGSVVYVFVLAAALWLVIAPLRTPSSRRVGYRTLLTFITLTAPPAVLYAIPVERLFSFDAAQNLNLAFLAVVAAWRVALLVYFLHRAVGFDRQRVLVATLAPLALVVALLTSIQLAERAFEAMGGVRERRPGDSVDDVLVALNTAAWFVALPMLLAYVALAWRSWRTRNAARREA